MIDAAVMIPVYRSRDGELHVVMILRNPGGVHGGQVAFPGGKHDLQDDTMLDTALREVREELGLIVRRCDVLAELPMQQTRTTGYRVFPYLAHQSAGGVAHCGARNRSNHRCGTYKASAAGVARQNDRTLSDLAESGAGSILQGRRP